MIEKSWLWSEVINFRSNTKRKLPRSYYLSFESFFKDKAQGISDILADLSLYRERCVDTIPSFKAELSFSIEGSKNVWRLVGVHPRFGPSWALVTQDNREMTHEIKGAIGDIFKIGSSDFDYTFVTIAEGAILKEINYIVFEDFAYSISRRWYNILKNTGKFASNTDRGD